LQTAAARDADLVVLPEGALGLEPELPEPAAVELISGGFRWQAVDGREPEQRSALLRFSPGAQRHASALDKARLVPLGEWIPFAQVLRWSGLSAVGGVQPGAPSRLLVRPAGNLAAAICYEIADGRSLSQAAAQGGGWLLASANLDPYPLALQEQFAALARLRAMESARWLVSAANTGPSLLIDPAGQVVEQLVPGRPAVQLLRVPVLHGRTAYARWGETPVVLLLVFGLGWRRWERIGASTEARPPGLG
jgi:apolipoprotein N-acyltransferase